MKKLYQSPYLDVFIFRSNVMTESVAEDVKDFSKEWLE